MFLCLFFLGDFVVFGEQLLMGFGVFFVYQDAVYGADLLALGFVIVSDALGAQVWVDFVDFFALRNGVIGAFGLADIAVDAFVSNE